MKQIYALICSMLPFLGFAQDKVLYDDNVVERVVPYFHSIKVNSAIQLYLSNGQEQKVVVSANNQKFIDELTTVVKDSILYIGFKVQKINTNVKLNAYVSYTYLKNLQAAGASSVEFVDVLKQDAFDISSSGAANVDMKVDVQSINVKVSGASDIRAKGTAQKAVFAVSGASNFKGYDLGVDQLVLSVAGASNIEIRNNQEMHITASGASNIRWKGEGVIKAANVAGASSMKKVNE